MTKCIDHKNPEQLRKFAELLRDQADYAEWRARDIEAEKLEVSGKVKPMSELGFNVTNQLAYDQSKKRAQKYYVSAITLGLIVISTAFFIAYFMKGN